ncbi:MAG: hypothetical protein QOF53_2871 [Nocardioidaceae bacterium]|nr:hypothetical protein [Nocardioidaceae bacterium]
MKPRPETPGSRARLAHPEVNAQFAVVAEGNGATGQLSHPAEMRHPGELTPEEYDHAKQRVLGISGPARSSHRSTRPLPTPCRPDLRTSFQSGAAELGHDGREVTARARLALSSCAGAAA